MLDVRIYDFDGTLFRSPEKPEGWNKGWWGRPESLEPPFVPRRPLERRNENDEPFWNVQLLTELQQMELDDHQPWVVTGRLEKRFYDRLFEIFEDAGLEGIFHDGRARLNNGGGTRNFKVRTFAEIIERSVEEASFMPKGSSAPKITIYDDREEHMGAFVNLVTDYLVRGEIHPASQVYLVKDVTNYVGQM